MRVSDSARVLFVHVQKTGGTTIDYMFDDEVPDARRVGRRSRHSPYRALLRTEPRLADYWSFGFVRNPWARMVSWFAMIDDLYTKYEAGVPEIERKFERFPQAWMPHAPYAHDFEKFVLEAPRTVEKVGRTQVHMLRGRGKGFVDFVGRTENFQHDLDIVRERLCLPVEAEVPRKNVSAHAHYSTYYNDRTRQAVADHFADDIQAFGYTFEQG